MNIELFSSIAYCSSFHLHTRFICCLVGCCIVSLRLFVVSPRAATSCCSASRCRVLSRFAITSCLAIASYLIVMSLLVVVSCHTTSCCVASHIRFVFMLHLDVASCHHVPLRVSSLHRVVASHLVVTTCRVPSCCIVAVFCLFCCPVTYPSASISTLVARHQR
jgi:hypothetical protein